MLNVHLFTKQCLVSFKIRLLKKREKWILGIKWFFKSYYHCSVHFCKYWQWPQASQWSPAPFFCLRQSQAGSCTAPLLIKSSCRLLSSQFLPGRQPRRAQSKPAPLFLHFAFACQVFSMLERKKKKRKKKKKPGVKQRSSTISGLIEGSIYLCVNGAAAVVAAPSPAPPFMYSSRTLPCSPLLKWWSEGKEDKRKRLLNFF